VDPNFTNEFSAHRGESDITLHLQKDGKILVAGIVGTLNGEEFPGLVRLDTNGAVDRTFWCETGNSLEGRVMDVAIQEDNRIVICGFFTQVNGTPCEHIARLNPDGSLDKTFQTPFLSLKEFGRKRFVRVPRLSKTAVTSEAPESSSTRKQSETAETSADLERIHISSMQREAGGAVVVFRGKPRGIYILQCKDTMTQPDWNNVSTNAAGANGVGMLRDFNANNYPTRFYRIAQP
jgi:hypothetical protein